MGAFGGSRELLASLAPQGPVYQAGTLSGNPLATAAGLAVLSTRYMADYADLARPGRILSPRPQRRPSRRAAWRSTFR